MQSAPRRRGKRSSGKLSQLVVVRLDQKRAVRQHPFQQAAGGVHHKTQLPSGKPPENLFVNIGRERRRNASGEDQRIPRTQRIELSVQRLKRLRVNLRPAAVDLGFLPAFQLDIDS